ncbi:MAG: alpha/beta fold hydrolase [Candidatus Melainabacteria bacterium]|nr:alpha/beta fold hydrolase [Candidatus Melainabacteria bacterium]
MRSNLYNLAMFPLYCLFVLIVFLAVSLAPVGPAVCAEHGHSSPVRPPVFTEEEKTANKLFWDGEYQKSLDCLLGSPEENPRYFGNLGFLYIGLDQADNAESSFKKALALADKPGSGRKNISALDQADFNIGLAESRYMKGQFSRALEGYKKALRTYERDYGKFSPALLPALEGVGGCYYGMGEYEKALPCFRRIAQIDVVQYGADHKRVGMSLNNLSDVYYKLGNCAAARPMFEQAFWIFKQDSTSSLLAEFDKPEAAKRFSKDELAVIRKRIKDVVMGTANHPEIRRVTYKLLEEPGFDENTPVCVEERPRDFANWRLKRGETPDPGFVRIDPTVEQKALIVCLHGLGLHHSSYDDFAARINPLGYGVIAFDVRGFGALSSEKGFDKVDLDSGLEDLGAMVSIVRDHNPGLPIFILGESMGGALALQFTAQYPRLVDGLVSSVPSGQRFKSKRTGLLVGLKLLENPNRPFEIGKRVVEQATDDERVKEDWLNDPDARLKLSPQELLDFQSFMNHNEKFARDITDTPVILFQGFQDHLVRPTGTYALYQALATARKDLIFIGSAEHLIFEEGQASEELIKMLVAWLDGQVKRLCDSNTASSGSMNPGDVR